MSHIDYERARTALLSQEVEYGTDWREDAKALASSGLYNTITKLVDPKTQEVVVDIGTGTGLQLLSLAGTGKNVITIGTERTRVNVMMAYEFLASLGLSRVVNAIALSELQLTADARVFWKPRLDAIHAQASEVRSQLKDKIFLLEDNILAPELLPYILNGKKIDAGILSMPGGSSARVLEWPFSPREAMTEEIKRSRIFDISNQTRFAFYHYMSEHVREGGRIVVAERMRSHGSVSPIHAGQMMTASHMRELMKYWEPSSGAIHETDFQSTTVELSASNHVLGTPRGDIDANQEYASHVFLIRYNRNNTPFNEPPLLRPS